MLVAVALLGLQHVTLVVADLDHSRRFYGTQLGLAELQRPESFTFGGAWFAIGSQEVHLIAASDATAEPGWGDPGASARTGSAPHLAIEVDDVAAEQARLESEGIHAVGGPRDRGDGVTQLYVLDPDAHLVELFERPSLDGTGGKPTS